MENNYIEIDIDSDILRSLTFLDILMEEYGFVDREKIKLKDHLLYDNFGYFMNILKLIKEGKIHIGINNAVFQESKHSRSLVMFMKKYAYFPNINLANHQQYADEARKLAYAYCTPYEIDGKSRPAPMKFVFIADINKYVPTNDTYGMAQAACQGRCFLTANGQDLIFNKKNNSRNHDRSRGVVEINIMKGYYDEQDNGSMIVPKPIHIHDFGAIVKNGIDELVISKSFVSMICADQVLTDDIINNATLFQFNETTI